MIGSYRQGEGDKQSPATGVVPCLHCPGTILVPTRGVRLISVERFMTATRLRTLPTWQNHPRSAWSDVRHLAVVVLLLSLFTPSVTRAQDTTPDPRQLLSPIHDVLSSSSWLWATGFDPRDPIGSPPFGVATGAFAVKAATPEAGVRDIRVTRQVGLTPVSAEPSLAIDPGDPRRVVLAVSALDLPSPAVYISEDGGHGWEGPIQVPVQTGSERSIGAPVIAFDSQGALLLASQTVSSDALMEGSLPLSVIRSRISVSRSDDGGRTWQNAVAAVQGEANLGLAPDASGMLSGGLSISFLDSPSLIAGANPRRPDSDTLTLAYTEFLTRYNVSQSPAGAALIANDASSTIRVVQSQDGGKTWSTPVSVTAPAVRGLAPPPSPEAPPDAIGVPEAPQPPREFVAPGDQVVQGAHVASFPDGSLAVAYLDSTLDGPQQGLARVMVATSADGGRSFAEPVVAAVLREMAAQPATAFFRWWDSSFPGIAASDEHLVIAVSTSASGDAADASDILIAHSPDRGATWDAPIAGESRIAGSDFFPVLSSSRDGTLLAAWMTLGMEPAGAGFGLNLISSDDGGITWGAIRDSDMSADVAAPNSLLGFPGGIYLGGRIAAASTPEQWLIASPMTFIDALVQPGQQIAVRLIPAR